MAQEGTFFDTKLTGFDMKPTFRNSKLSIKKSEVIPDEFENL